jgi:hypothetical protein
MTTSNSKVAAPSVAAAMGIWPLGGLLACPRALSVLWLFLTVSFIVAGLNWKVNSPSGATIFAGWIVVWITRLIN